MVKHYSITADRGATYTPGRMTELTERQAMKTTKISTRAQAGPAKNKIKPPTRKKLPWLDGKSSPAVPSTPSDRKASILPLPQTFSSERVQPTPSPFTKSAPMSSRKVIPTIRPAESDPTLRRGSFIPLTKRRVSSVGTNNPTPVLGRGITTPGLLLQSVHSMRPSIVHIQESVEVIPCSPDENPFSDVLTQRPSLALIPDHPAPSPTPDPIPVVIQRNTSPDSPSPRTVKPAKVSPTPPILNHDPFEPVNGRKISNAIEGLENLVQEAIDIADVSRDQEQVEEIYDIIEDATNAIQQVSVTPTQNLMATSSPLAASESSEEVSEFSSTSEDSLTDSPNESPQNLREGATFAAPIQRNIIHEDSMPSQQRTSNAIDWAYPNRKSVIGRLPTPSLNSDDDTSTRRGRSRYSTQSDLLLPLQPVQTSARDHVDFLLRPSVVRGQSRGRSRRRKGSGSDPDANRHRRHRNFRSPNDSSRHHSRLQSRATYGRVSPSFDEEDAHVYRNLSHKSRWERHELSLRDQVHHHTLNLHRNHRRQPIARNWGTRKKRITATVACINTALLGIIVGIYVSSTKEKAGRCCSLWRRQVRFPVSNICWQMNVIMLLWEMSCS